MANQKVKKSETSDNRWPHRVAWVLVCATFSLIWMGGLVTTYNAGMAVPDWPDTYGDNLFLHPPKNWMVFLYPSESWREIWDIFLEHSHRLIGAGVGLITIALAVLLWLYDRRKWMRGLGGVALAGVCFQGTLGGLRVLGSEIHQTRIFGTPAPLFLAVVAALLAVMVQAVLLSKENQRKWVHWLRVLVVAGVCYFLARFGVEAAGDKLLLAKIHGSTAPVFFVLCAALVTFTSRPWREARQRRDFPAARLLQRLALACAMGIYVQIVLGIQLRHTPLDAAPWWFLLWVWLHVIVAGLVVAGVVWLVVLMRRRVRDEPMISRRVWLLAGLFATQVVLGVVVWVTNYGWPLWFTEYVVEWKYTIVAGGWFQAVMTTAHVGVGLLNLAAGLSLTVWSRRLFRGVPKSVSSR